MKNIKGYEKYYAITQDGKIWSHIKQRWINPFETMGYLRVDLCRKRFYIHRLLAENFFEIEYNEFFVRHKDNNRMNNSLNNLKIMPIVRKYKS